MTECKSCGKSIYMPFRCSRCGLTYCNKHRISHACSQLIVATPPPFVEPAEHSPAPVNYINEMGYKIVSNSITTLRGFLRVASVFPVMLCIIASLYAILMPVVLIHLSVAIALFIALVIMYSRALPPRELTGQFVSGGSAGVIKALHRLWVTRVSLSVAFNIIWIALVVMMSDWFTVVLAAAVLFLTWFTVKSCKKHESMLRRVRSSMNSG